VRPRLGNEAFERLVAPLLGGVYAGDADELSARSTVPEIDSLARNNRSLYLGLRRMRRGAPGETGGSSLVTTKQGLGVVVAELAARLDDANIRLNSTVTDITRTGEGFRLDMRDAHTGIVNPSIVADEVVLATPAFATARLLAFTAPAAAAALAAIPYADVATVTLAYRCTALTRPLDGTGFLVPPGDGRLLVGCSWSSAKWPHLADGKVALIRCMVGRSSDGRFTGMDDDTLVRRVHEELVAAMGVDAEPIDARVQRWDRGMPQYVVGHRERIDAVTASVASVPGLYLVGAAYRGVGIASCIVDAERAAQEISHRFANASLVEGAAS
jgi:oxygen-dependent protoporphyrinogen oxidase